MFECKGNGQQSSKRTNQPNVLALRCFTREKELPKVGLKSQGLHLKCSNERNIPPRINFYNVLAVYCRCCGPKSVVSPCATRML